MSVARFKVRQAVPMDDASKPQTATVEVDRAAELFTVRPFRRRRAYTLPLNRVAQMVVRGILLAERLEHGRTKAAAKRAVVDARRERQRAKARANRRRAK